MHPSLRPSQLAFLPRTSNAASILLRSGPASYYPRTTQLARLYATYKDIGGDPESKSSASKRRGVTVLSDDGRYEWGELTRGEKVARATQQSVNFVVVLAGAVLTVSFEGFLLS